MIEENQSRNAETIGFIWQTCPINDFDLGQERYVRPIESSVLSLKKGGGEVKRTSAVVKSIIRIMKDDWSMFHFFLSFFFVFLFFLSLPKYDLYFRELYFSHKLLQFNVSTYITHYCVPSVSRQIVLKVGIQRLQVNLR